MNKKLIALIGLVSLFFCASLSAKTFVVGGIAYATLSDSTVVVVPIENFEYYGKVVIPETVVDEEKQYSVIAIGSNAFENCYCLTQITLPNTLIEIGKGAFRNCLNLKAISLPASLEILGSSAFSTCPKLTKVIIPAKVEVIPEMCFENCTSITSDTIGSSVVKILHHAFSKCAAIQSVKIPSNVKSIADYAFNECSKLTTVTFAKKDDVKVAKLAFVRSPYGDSTSSRGAAIKNDSRFKISNSVTY